MALIAVVDSYGRVKKETEFPLVTGRPTVRSVIKDSLGGEWLIKDFEIFVPSSKLEVIETKGMTKLNLDKSLPPPVDYRMILKVPDISLRYSVNSDESKMRLLSFSENIDLLSELLGARSLTPGLSAKWVNQGKWVTPNYGKDDENWLNLSKRINDGYTLEIKYDKDWLSQIEQLFAFDRTNDYRIVEDIILLMPMEKMFNFVRLVAGEEALKRILEKEEFWKKKFQIDYPEPWQRFTYRQCTSFLKYYEMNKWLSSSMLFFRSRDLTGRITSIYSERIRHTELEYDNYDLYVDILRSYKLTPLTVDHNGNTVIKSMRFAFQVIPLFNDDGKYIMDVLDPWKTKSKKDFPNTIDLITEFRRGLEFLKDKSVIIVFGQVTITTLLERYRKYISVYPVESRPQFESLKNFVDLVTGERKPMCYSSLCVNDATLLEESDTSSLFCSKSCQTSYHTFMTNIARADYRL